MAERLRFNNWRKHQGIWKTTISRLVLKDHKTSRLAIKSIQTERINGKEYYKVTAEATDLIQRNAQKTFEEGF